MENENRRMNSLRNLENQENNSTKVSINLRDSSRKLQTGIVLYLSRKLS